VKSIDNALQRIKRKVELHLRGRSDEAGAQRELVSVGSGEGRVSVKPASAAGGHG
jgi:hypothetical protein